MVYWDLTEFKEFESLIFRDVSYPIRIDLQNGFPNLDGRQLAHHVFR